MCKIKVFTRSYIDRLYKDSQENPVFYLNNQMDIPHEAYAVGETDITIPEECLDAVNNSSGNTHEDYDNAIRLYEALDINLTTASDPRLWTCLTHTIFFKYMKKRWPLETLDTDKKKSRIRDRYHLRNLSLNNLSRNGIARLWWMAHLTKDEKRTDKYELTKVLTSRADLIAGLLERYLGTNNNIRSSILEFLLKNEEYLKDEDKRRQLFKQINLLGGVKNLPLLNKSEIETEIIKIAL